MTNTLEPFFLVELLPVLDQKLFEVLESLSPDDWEKQSLAPQWTVKDIAAHLLDGNLRTLSMLRDGYYGEAPNAGEEGKNTVHFLNRLNADWVQATRRLSPRVLLERLKSSGEEYCEYLKSLDPFEKSSFAVDWAGETESLNWFHIAREYTEKWHHQQQIRFAVGKTEDLYQKQLYFPYLETSMCALPHHYRTVTAEEGTGISFHITGHGGGMWFLHFRDNAWKLSTYADKPVRNRVTIPPEIAWRIFTKGISAEEAIAASAYQGKSELCIHIFEMLAVMALKDR